MSVATLLSIGAIAEATGVTVSAIRYYDDLGIVTTTRRVGGKRHFTPDVIGRVNFVRRAQDVGFTLDEIKAILDGDAGKVPSLVEAKIADLQDKRLRLDTMISMLEVLRECGCEEVTTCPRLTTS